MTLLILTTYRHVSTLDKVVSTPVILQSLVITIHDPITRIFSG
jgi:hypothetical protein